MTARFLVGDTRARLTELDDDSVDLVLTSPPFLALRSYLPDGHPDKHLEIGSEPTPAAYLDVLLQLTADWGRVLTPHGSIAVELGDTYAGSGGAGGDYDDGGLREAQQRFTGSAKQARVPDPSGMPPHRHRSKSDGSGGEGWPLPKSLACIPQLYQVALAYGTNPLTGTSSPAGRWRVRTLKPWIRSNPPVGALGDKERPATSYVIVACKATDRWFDLDAVRTPNDRTDEVVMQSAKRMGRFTPGSGPESKHLGEELRSNPGGAPPRDWWHHVDAILDAELAARAETAGRPNGGNSAGPKIKNKTDGGWATLEPLPRTLQPAQGVHLRRALERAGILTTLEALDVSPKGYSGAHYAVWPPELCRLLIDEMCPRRVCTTCRQPSRRIAETVNALGRGVNHSAHRPDMLRRDGLADKNRDAPEHAERVTVGWSDCGCADVWQCDFCKGQGDHPDFVRHAHSCHALDPTFTKVDRWRPGHILDPFAGSGTTLAVATGMARTATGIDIDPRNADLALERVGMFLDIDHGTREIPA